MLICLIRKKKVVNLSNAVSKLSRRLILLIGFNCDFWNMNKNFFPRLTAALFFAAQLFTSGVQAQLLDKNTSFSRADSLRGTLTPLRTAYDIQYYHLNVKVDIDGRSISGSNLFRFRATEDFNRLQFDLFDNLKVEKVLYGVRNLLLNENSMRCLQIFRRRYARGRLILLWCIIRVSRRLPRTLPGTAALFIAKTVMASPGWQRRTRDWERAAGGRTKIISKMR